MSIDELLTAIDGLEGEALEKVRVRVFETVFKESTRVIKEGVAAFFVAHPDVTAVRWDQYTPYFNDGDACTFRACEAEVSLANRDNDEDEDDDYGEFLDEYGLEYGEKDKSLTFSKGLIEDLGGISGLLEENEEALESIFGDHVTVTVRPGKDPEVSECSHE